MQDLSAENDTTDNNPAMMNKRSTWYGPSTNTSSFDPEEDTDILQRQYAPSIPEEELIEQRMMQRSSSDT